MMRGMKFNENLILSQQGSHSQLSFIQQSIHQPAATHYHMIRVQYSLLGMHPVGLRGLCVGKTDMTWMGRMELDSVLIQTRLQF